MRWNRVTKIFSLSVALLLVAALVYGGRWYSIERRCRHRGQEFQRKVETLRKDAKKELPVGTRREDVARFLERNGMQLTEDAPRFDKSPHSVVGTLHFAGDKKCGTFLCRDDRSGIVLQVGVDEHGIVIVEPDVNGIYTNCL